MLAVVPMTMISPLTLLKQQTNLITGEISDGERFIVAFGHGDNDPALYIHLTDAVLKFPLTALVENGYRALASLNLDDAWTDFERDLDRDPPNDTGRFYINSIYEAVVALDVDSGATVITYARRDRQPLVHPGHWRRMIDDLVGAEWGGIHALASGDDTQFTIICAPLEPINEVDDGSDT